MPLQRSCTQGKRSFCALVKYTNKYNNHAVVVYFKFIFCAEFINELLRGSYGGDQVMQMNGQREHGRPI